MYKWHWKVCIFYGEIQWQNTENGAERMDQAFSLHEEEMSSILSEISKDEKSEIIV